MTKLAILGGTKVLTSSLPTYRSLGENELVAAQRVIRSGRLSCFYGSWGDNFFGGFEVRTFEDAWATRFRVRHAISVNSATSGLYAAMGAIGIGPGDEVIVPPYTMSATVMAPLIYGGIPVFADIEPDTFGLDPAAVEDAITSKTRAIIAVNLFGHPARLDELRALARKHNLYLVEDNAQAPLAEDKGRLAGSIGDIGVFSLNFHKHIHTGEGGMCVTNNDELALRLKLIRNHGENAVEAVGLQDIANVVGFNFRLTEIQAAIGREQLKQIDEHVQRRVHLAESLTEGIRGLDGLTAPMVRPGCRHVYYTWALRYNGEALGVSRELFCRALAAEGFPHAQGYVRPLYLLPIFQRRVAIGRDGFPFSISPGPRYAKGMCPVCERMYEKEVILFEPCAYEVSDEAMKLLIEAIQKVYRGRNDLRQLQTQLQR